MPKQVFEKLEDGNSEYVKKWMNHHKITFCIYPYFNWMHLAAIVNGQFYETFIGLTYKETFVCQSICGNHISKCLGEKQCSFGHLLNAADVKNIGMAIDDIQTKLKVCTIQPIHLSPCVSFDTFDNETHSITYPNSQQYVLTKNRNELMMKVDSFQWCMTSFASEVRKATSTW